jgi:hypothetical protein
MTETDRARTRNRPLAWATLAAIAMVAIIAVALFRGAAWLAGAATARTQLVEQGKPANGSITNDGLPFFALQRAAPEAPPAVEPDHPHAKTKILGRVFDAMTDGGVGGARVRVRASFGEPHLGPADGDGSVTYVSAPDGSVELRGIPPGQFEVEVLADGYVPSRTYFKKFSAIEDDSGFEFALSRGGAISGRVVDARGRAIEGASVAAVRSRDTALDPRSPSTTTDDDGRFLIELVDSGSIELIVKHPDHPAAIRYLEASEEPERNVEIVLPSGARLSGLVRDENGPLAGARLLLEAIHQDGNDVVVSRDHPLGLAANTDASGRFMLSVAELDRYVLRAEAPRHRGQTLVVVPGLSDGPLEITLASAAQMSGLVLAPDGRPLEGARVTVIATSDDAYAEQTTGSDGRFSLDGLPADGPLEVHVAHHRFPILTIEEERVRPHHEYRLDPESRILGFVKDRASGAPITRFAYQLLGPIRARSGLISATGALEIDQLAEGTYTLVVSADGFAPTSVPGVVVGRGLATTGLDVLLDRAATIHGSILGEDTGARFVRASGSGRSRAARVAHDGTFTLTQLSPGTYDLTVFGERLVGRLSGVTVRGGEVLDVQVPVAP